MSRNLSASSEDDSNDSTPLKNNFVFYQREEDTFKSNLSEDSDSDDKHAVAAQQIFHSEDSPRKRKKKKEKIKKKHKNSTMQQIGKSERDSDDDIDYQSRRIVEEMSRAGNTEELEGEETLGISLPKLDASTEEWSHYSYSEGGSKIDRKHPIESSTEKKKRKAGHSLSDSDSEEPEKCLQKQKPKKFKVASSLDKPLESGNKGRLIMEKMGFRFGEGLGKNKQGRVDPVELSKQKGKRGLGLKMPKIEATEDWYQSLEEYNVKEEVNWLNYDMSDCLELDTLQSWMKEGPRLQDMDGLTEFCEEDLLNQILQNKSVFDELEGDELRRARARSNPFETIKGVYFLNRAAMKMANMDARFDWMFTNPKDEMGVPIVNDKNLLYFADVCAGPGGFSEYILWRKRWRAKGIGFTLKDSNDFKLSDFYAGPCETFEPYYGVEGDGNVYNPENITSLTELVMEATDGKGVHFMMADGGFSCEGKESIQELLSKQLYLCQCLVGLSIVRVGGHFVCKLFDLFSPFSVGLVYLMYRSFKSICLFKPNTSRPANSERYIICKWKREESDSIRQYMFEMNERILQLSNSDNDVNYCVPTEVLKSDENFFDYIYKSNNKIGEQQVVNLVKIAAFYANPNLIENRQLTFRKECLHSWNIDDLTRLSFKPPRGNVEEDLKKITPRLRMEKNLPCVLIAATGKALLPVEMEKCFTSVYEWNCLIMGSENKLFFYYSMGRNQVYRCPPGRSAWTKVSDFKFCLSPGTLVYGEIVDELIGEGRSQLKLPALHILDVIAIGYENVSEKHYNERLEICSLFVNAIKKYRTKDNPVRVRKPIMLENTNDVFKSLIYRYNKKNLAHCVIETEDYSYQPKGIVFHKITKEPWTKCKSRSTLHLYIYNIKTQMAIYEQDIKTSESFASVEDCVRNQLIWQWEEGVGIKGEGPKPNILHKDQLLEYVKKKRVG